MADDSTARIRAAASMLTKGGTLTNEACPKCGGVQVKFADKKICVNCGNETMVENSSSSSSRISDAQTANTTTTQSKASKKGGGEEEQQQHQFMQASSNLSSAASSIEQKIALIAIEVRNETDISLQKQKAELIEGYLRILERIKNLVG